ncbi:MAG: hypothetical protein NPINA01_10880 [Nitrospinaceae bacterium]|nr:MAG: hypothetical protein NPINA01_10880 [Nitrospinaceae bacterium]
MRFAITLLSFPALIWAYVVVPQLHQFDWKWLILGFFIYCYLLLRFLSKVVESPQYYGFTKGRSGNGETGGGYFADGGAGGGDCGGGGGGGDC